MKTTFSKKLPVSDLSPPNIEVAGTSLALDERQYQGLSLVPKRFLAMRTQKS